MEHARISAHHVVFVGVDLVRADGPDYFYFVFLLSSLFGFALLFILVSERCHNYLFVIVNIFYCCNGPLLLLCALIAQQV